MYSGTVRRVSRQDIKLVTVSMVMEGNDLKKDLYRNSSYAGSLNEYMNWLNAEKKPLHDVLGFRKQIDGITVEIALQWCVDVYSEKILGYANSIRTIDGGTHIDGVKASITRIINIFAKKSKVVKAANITLSSEHVGEGLTCIVSVSVPNPEFEGQTQTRLANPYVREIVDQSVQDYLREYFESHPDVTESIISKSLNAYKTALAVKRTRGSFRSNRVSTPCTIPEKLTNNSSEKSDTFIGGRNSCDGAPKLSFERHFQSLDSSGELVRKLEKDLDITKILVTPYEHANQRNLSLPAKGHCLGGSDGYLYLLPQSKRTQEQAWSDDPVSAAPGQSLENISDSSFEKNNKKMKSHPCFPSPQTADYSNPPNPKSVSIKTPKDITHVSNKTRPFIPIGPGFQAEIPVWIAPTKKGKFYGSPGDSQTLRWLGIGVWPTYSLKKKVHYKKIGEGRPDSCSCPTPRSTSCIKQHTKEARELLEKEIGNAFYTWKFDEMGEEVVSKSWTAKEEQRFIALVDKNPLSSSEGFWEFASKSFPRKSEKDLHRYYHNVFLINRMRLLANNSSDDHIDSDDDNYDDFLAG